MADEIEFKVQADDIHKVISMLKFMRKQELKPALRGVGQEVVKQTNERFDEEKAPDGTPWAPLLHANKKAEVRRTSIGSRKAKSRHILNDSGNLKKIKYLIKQNAVTIGPTVDYGIFHQYGTKRKGENKSHFVPARPFMGITSENTDDILNILRDLYKARYGIE